jgi:hypothetical protein
VAHIPSLADFDYFFLFGAWFQLIGALASRPSLSLGFVQDQPPFDRVVAVPSEPTFIFDCYFKLICARPLPVF